MSQSLNLTSAASFQAYVQDYYDTLLTKMFFGFETSKYTTAHEGVKNRLALTSLTIGNLVRRYTSTFNVVAGTHTFAAKNLEVFDNKVDLAIIPKDFESSYLGRFRQKGQNSMDLPFEGDILMQTIQKINQEMEIAIWQGDKASSPASTDLLAATFDGFATIITDNIGSLTPVVSGALTASNAYTTIESIYSGLASQYQDAGVEVFMNNKTKLLAIQEYRAAYGKYTERPDGQLGFDLGANVNYRVCPGMPNNLIVITPQENLHYGYDSAMDANFINFEQEDRKIKMWTDFKMGAQIAFISPDILGVNVVA
jgi:hypothetical protein